MIDSTRNNNKAMETTLNSQLTTHNSRSYSPPHITVVEFKVEHCFTTSQYLANGGSRDFFAQLLSGEDNYYEADAVGDERFSDFTDAGGNYTPGGSW